MRYIIIPLAIILYCIWTYKAFKDCFKTHKPNIVNSLTSYMWFGMHFIIFTVIIFLIMGYYTIKYW